MTAPQPKSELGIGRWLASRGLEPLAEAACLTLIRGLGRDDILSVFGADLDQPALTLDEALEDVASCVGVLVSGEGFVAIEPNGGEGLRPEVLRDLSRSGAASSLYWNVNGMIVLSCASRGRSRGSEELLDLQRDSDLPKAVLGPLLAAHDSGKDALVAGFDAMTRFVALPVEFTSSSPPVFHRLVPHLEDLTDAFHPRQQLDHDAPALLHLIDDSSPAAQRRTAEWVASWTLAKVGLDQDPRAISVTSQFGRDRPTRLGSGLGLATEVHRTTGRLAATDPSRFGGPAGPELVTAWMREWAIRALRYTTVPAPLTAALGAVHCLRPFMRVPAEPNANGLFPLPDLAAEAAAAAELVRPILIAQDHPGQP